MFSSRRYSPRYKSRQYYHKKNINRKFAPAAYKSNPPTYYQQKGRIIQSSPLHLYSIPRQLPNSETLKKMYNTLLKINYPNVGPNSTPQVPLQPYLASFTLTAAQLSDLPDGKLNPTNFSTLVRNTTELTNLPSGWEYKFELFTIEFRQRIASGLVESSQYHIDLVHPIFVANPYSIVLKTVSTTGSGSTNSIVCLTSLIPVDANQVKVTRLAYTTSGYSVTSPTIASNDPVINDNGWYPILSTAYSDNQNYLQFVLNSGSFSDELYLMFSVLCIPIESF